MAAAVIIVGMLLQYILQQLKVVGGNTVTDAGIPLEMGAVSYGTLVFLVIILLTVVFPSLNHVFVKSSGFSFSMSILLAMNVALSTLIIPKVTEVTIFRDVLHSFHFTGMIGLFSAGLLSILFHAPERMRTLKTITVTILHTGMIIIIAGTAVTSVFSVEGFIDTHEGEKANHFTVLYRGMKTNKVIALPSEMELLDFQVEHYNDEYKLRIYEHSEGTYDLVQSMEVSKGVKLIDDSYNGKIEVRDFYPAFMIERKVQAREIVHDGNTPAIYIKVYSDADIQSGWLFASNDKPGRIENEEIFIYFMNASSSEVRDSLSVLKRDGRYTILISGKELLMWVADGDKENEEAITIDTPFIYYANSYKVFIDNYYQNVELSYVYTNSSDSASNPVAHVNHIVEEDTTEVFLSAIEQVPYDLGDHKYLLLEKISDQPKSFKSIVKVREQEYEIKVNHPLNMDGYKIYQADFREDDDSFSGFQVTKDPGRPIVKSGFYIVLFSLLLLIWVAARSRN